MSINSMKFFSPAIIRRGIGARGIGRVAALAFACAALAGCVYYPSGYGYAAGPGYYQPAYVAPPVVVGGWWGGGWGRGWGRGWRGGDDD